MLIPEEESCAEEEEDEEGEGEMNSNEWRQWWGGVDALYDQYSERMLFDWMSVQ